MLLRRCTFWASTAVVGRESLLALIFFVFGTVDNSMQGFCPGDFEVPVDEAHDLQSAPSRGGGGGN